MVCVCVCGKVPGALLLRLVLCGPCGDCGALLLLPHPQLSTFGGTLDPHLEVEGDYQFCGKFGPAL